MVHFAVRNDIGFIQCIKLRRTALDDAVPLGQFIFGLLKNNFPFMDKYDIIGNLLQVTGNVGGYQYGMPLVLDEAKQHIQNIIPDNRV